MNANLPCCLSLALVLSASAAPAAPAPTGLDDASVERLARLALACVDREYPNKIAHVLNSDADVAPPRALTPSFFGCFDWHSSVHGHWLLARAAREHAQASFAAEARAALDRSLTTERIAAEVAYLSSEGRETFERPYGLAWLLQLAAELREWDDPDARRWSDTLAPLERVAADRLRTWVPKLAYPIRTGEHSQTAFAFGLALDWARRSGDTDLAAVLEERTRALYLGDRACPIAFEPSGQDFLSPCLAEADLVRRILPPAAFASWLGAFLPDLPLDGGDAWLPVGVVTDPTDGKLAHLDGLNLSRAWMLEGIVSGLPEGDLRIPALLDAAATHRAAGLTAVTGDHYEGGHWLGSFATYLVTARGIAGTAPVPSLRAAAAPSAAPPPAPRPIETAPPPATAAPPPAVDASAPVEAGGFVVGDVAPWFEGRRPYGTFEVAEGAALADHVGRDIAIEEPAVIVSREREGVRGIGDLVRDALVRHLAASDLAPQRVVLAEDPDVPTDALVARTTVRYLAPGGLLSRARFAVEIEWTDSAGNAVARYEFLDYATVRADGPDGTVTVDNFDTRMRSLEREIRRALR